MPKFARVLIKLVSTAGTGTFIVTSKNRLNTPEKITLRKFDPKVGRHVEFKEQKL